jgi:hypothetical protein
MAPDERYVSRRYALAGVEASRYFESMLRVS